MLLFRSLKDNDKKITFFNTNGPHRCPNESVINTGINRASKQESGKNTFHDIENAGFKILAYQCGSTMWLKNFFQDRLPPKKTKTPK